MLTKIWLGWLWRQFVVTLVMMVAGGIIGGVLGILLGFLGFEAAAVSIVCGLVGLGLGLYGSYLAFKWTIGKDCGGWKLAVVPSN